MTARSRGGGGGRLDGVCVLVVDDDPAVCSLLRALLNGEGATVLEARNGHQALEHATSIRPDVITLDLSMPGTDGIEAFSQLRMNLVTRDIPVCIITGFAELRQIVCDRPVAQPEGFISKPFDPEHVVHTLHRIVGAVARTTGLEHPAVY
jgi:CheY-like chemotaxis protein